MASRGDAVQQRERPSRRPHGLLLLAVMLTALVVVGCHSLVAGEHIEEAAATCLVALAVAGVGLAGAAVCRLGPSGRRLDFTPPAPKVLLGSPAPTVPAARAGPARLQMFLR